MLNDLGSGPIQIGIIVFLLAVTIIVLVKFWNQRSAMSAESFSEENVMSMLEVGQESGVIKEEG